MIYTFITTIQLTSTDLPQWIPLIIDSGLGASIGIQNIPVEPRRRAIKIVGEYAGSLCGGCQLNVRQVPSERPYALGSTSENFRQREQDEAEV